MTYYYKNFAWTAFTEADLLANGKNGHDFGMGDSFVMQHATVTMSTFDNDSKLSGDSWYDWYDKSEDRSGQNAHIDNKAVGCKMFAEQYHVLHGSDGKTYYMIEIKVEGHDSAGAGNGYFTFYGAQPAAGVELSVVNTCNVAGSWIDYSCLGAGKAAPPNTPPTFTNVPANGVFCVDENTKLVIDLNAKDADCDPLSFSLAGGEDAALFQIDAKTGVLSFKAAPDFEAPGSKDGDNLYKVIVAVDDGKGGVTHAELSVCVKDVDETPKCVVYEAEEMKLSCYTVKCASSASGGEYIALTGYHGSAAQVFDGASGDYDLTLRFWDAARGDGYIKILVNGQEVGAARLNAETNKWSEVTLEGLDLSKGDVITLKGAGNGCEYAIIDNIKLCPADPAIEPGALEGRLFVDADANGLDDVEPGVAGVSVQLLDSAGNVVATTTTGDDGGYRFDGLQPGDYRVIFPTAVEGRVLTDQNVGPDDRIDSDADTGTGITDSATVIAGEVTKDVDAGLTDPGTASLGNLVFLDTDKNGIQDGSETGVQNVTVTLFLGGTAIATTTTDAAGNYLFTGLKAGTYTVGFTEKAGFDLTAANQGGDEALDSDADPVTGLTGPITLGIGQTNLDVDAGLVIENRAPEAMDDAAKTCADDAVTVDVLANDSDLDGDALTITQVAGQDIAEGGSVDVDGVTIALVDGKLVFDGSAAYADLILGQKAMTSISYQIADGAGGFDTANVDLTFCGAKNTLDTIKDSLPTGGTLVLTRDGALGGDFYGVTLSGTGDDRFDGNFFDITYCVAAYEPIKPDVAIPYNIYLADQASVPSGIVARPQNLDMVNWILNQGFGDKDNGDGNAQNYTEGEIQGAIWGLTDNIVFVNSSLGTNANAREIYDLALANGEGFQAGEGDIVGLILDPTAEAEAAGNSQPLIIGVEWDMLEQDCFCFV